MGSVSLHVDVHHVDAYVSVSYSTSFNGRGKERGPSRILDVYPRMKLIEP